MTTLSTTYRINPDYLNLLSVDGLKALIHDMDNTNHLYQIIIEHLPERIGDYWLRMAKFRGEWHVGYYNHSATLIAVSSNSHKTAVIRLYDRLIESKNIEPLQMIKNDIKTP